MGPTTHLTRMLFSKLHLLLISICSCVYAVSISSTTFTLQAYTTHSIYYNCIYIFRLRVIQICVYFRHTFYTHLCTHTLSPCLPFMRLNKPHCFNHLILNSLFFCINLEALFYINSSWINNFWTLVEGINISLFICKNTFLDPDRELLTLCTDAQQWNQK